MASSDAGASHGNPLGVLVVDDDDGVRRFLGKALTALGCRVYLCVDARSALAAYEANREEIDLAFVDVRMPEISGPELIERLRKVEPSLPVITISGFPDGDLTQGPTADCPHLSKPFSLAQVQQIVQTYGL